MMKLQYLNSNPIAASLAGQLAQEWSPDISMLLLKNLKLKWFGVVCLQVDVALFMYMFIYIFPKQCTVNGQTNRTLLHKLL